MKIYKNLIVSCVLVFVNACSSTARISIPDHQLIEDTRYNVDRTMTLKDITPVIKAYVKHPHRQCEIKEFNGNQYIVADLSALFEDRVYIINGVEKCIR